MIEIEFKPEEIIGKITELQRVQIPRASGIALNKAVYEASQQLKKEAQSRFDNPVPFTVNSFLYEKSNDKDGLYLPLLVAKRRAGREEERLGLALILEF